jgi:hypothetical protein
MNNHRLNLEWIPAAYRTDEVNVDKTKTVPGSLPQIVKSNGIYPSKKSLKQKMCKR